MTRLTFASPATVTRRWGFGVPGFALAAALLTAPLPAQQPAAPAAAAQPAPAAAADQGTAQPAASGADVGVTTIKQSVNEVNLIFTVTDKHGRYIPNLRLNDFALLDDGKAPAKVTSFHQQIKI